MAESKFVLAPEATIWALRSHEDLAGHQFEALRRGEGRFGWGHYETGDMRKIKEKYERDGWQHLTHEEKECWNPFLLEIKPGDWVVYINVPEYGKCTTARVTSPYYFAFDRELEDLGHRFGVDPETVRTFDRNADFVHPYLSRRLKLQGRQWQITARAEFAELLRALEALPLDAATRARTADDNRRQLRTEIEAELAEITRKIQRTHPGRDLEVLVKRAFEQMPGVLDVQQIATRVDRGADLIVIHTAGLPFGPLQRTEACLVQVKSYEGKLYDARAIEDLRRAFREHPEANMGLIVSTADGVTPEFERQLRALQSELGEVRTVRCLCGPDVALLVANALSSE